MIIDRLRIGGYIRDPLEKSVPFVDCTKAKMNLDRSLKWPRILGLASQREGISHYFQLFFLLTPTCWQKGQKRTFLLPTLAILCATCSHYESLRYFKFSNDHENVVAAWQWLPWTSHTCPRNTFKAKKMGKALTIGEQHFYKWQQLSNSRR